MISCVKTILPQYTSITAKLVVEVKMPFPLLKLSNTRK